MTEIDLHKGMVDERPGSRSLQHVVQAVLEPPVVHVSPAALRAVYERLPQEAQPGPLLPPQALRPGTTCWQQTVSRVVHHLPSVLDISHAAAFGSVPRRRPHPEPGGAFVSAVVAGHGIAGVGIKCAEVFTSMRVVGAAPRTEQCLKRVRRGLIVAGWVSCFTVTLWPPSFLSHLEPLTPMRA